MRKFRIYYKDGVFAEAITFVNKNDSFIKNYLNKVIREYNKNVNPDWHIDKDCIKEI